MEYKFLIDGESPEFGTYKAGNIRELPKAVGDLFARRGLVEEVKQTKTTVKVDKEV